MALVDVQRSDVRGGRRFPHALVPLAICGTAGVLWLLVVNAVMARAQGQGPKPAQKPASANEIVMVPGMEITATNELGSITIVAGPGLQRTYKWGTCEGTVEMIRRPTRWHGSLGIYYPGPGNHWKECDGIARAVVQECWWHFETVDAAVEEIRRSNDGFNAYNRNATPVQYYVCTGDGLVVMWSKTPGRQQLNVEVRQVLIDGRKPTRLPGSRDDDVSIRYHKLDGAAGK